MNYSLILADDESFALEHMKHFIDWKEYGFSLVKTFSFGQDVLDWLSQNHADLIITDIKMPDVDGIEIAKICSLKYPDTLVVFMSAYNDVDYIRNALHYSVTDYILKPVKLQQLTEVLTNCKNKLDEKIQKNETISSGNFISERKFNDIQLVFSDLLCGTFRNRQELEKVLSEIGINKEAYYPCVLFNMHIENYKQYISTVRNNDPLRLMLAVSNIIHNIENKYWFVIVRHAYNNIEVFGYTNTDFKLSEHNHSPFDILKQQLKSILNLDITITQLRTYENIFSLLNKSEKSEIEFYTEENSIIDMVNKFIHENYKKPVSTQHAAKYVSLSTAYFCIYYKQHTDENFLDTLNRYRIQKAIETLDNATIEKLSTLHTQVGFPNKSYFYRLFRQYTGLTPTQYINSKKENKGE